MFYFVTVIRGTFRQRNHLSTTILIFTFFQLYSGEKVSGHEDEGKVTCKGVSGFAFIHSDIAFSSLRLKGKR